MNQNSAKRNRKKMIVMFVLFILAAALYMTVGVKFENQKLFEYSMKIRTPKLIAMMITAYAIGSAAIVFQSIINNTIVTPCLLGMDALYTMIHTILVFILGSGSALVVNANCSFLIDLVIMGVTATIIYSYLFKKTKHNVLYVLLIGTVLTSLFSSIQSNVNSEIMILSITVLLIVAIALRKELYILDVLTLGKEQAINLGVDYDASMRKLLLGVTLYIAVATAMVGPLAFLGLIIANLSRQLLRTYRHTQLISGSVLFGMIILIGGQLIVEKIFVYAIPVSVFITLFGGMYFLYLLLRRRT